jgi:hypothetical protein
MAETDRLHDEEDIRRTARELQEATAEDFAGMVRLLRSRPDGQVLGQAEFEVRDLAHTIAAKVVQAEVNARQRGATGAPASAARPAVSRPSSRATAPGRSSA